jgi:hypothetical protein
MKVNAWIAILSAVGLTLTTLGCKAPTSVSTDSSTSASPSIAASEPSSTPAAIADITGTWNIGEARGVDGADYTGTVNIQPFGDVYRLTWDSSIGSYKGVGFLVDDHLFVGSGTEPETYGVVVYQINPNGTLNGQWTLPSREGQLGTEVATRSAEGGLAGTYQIQGINPGNEGGYDGTLEIQETGDTYQLTWQVASNTYTGVGLRSGDWLAVSWGEPGSFGIVDYTIDGDAMDGRWAVLDKAQLGVEDLAR